MRYEPHQVTPFGNLRINACLRLSEAYRSLPRPSSPAGAKASTTYPLYLTLFKNHFVGPACAEPKLVRNTLFIETFLGPNVWLFEIVSLTLYAVVKELPIHRKHQNAADGGQDWTRTSDPRLIKAVL